MQRLTIAVLALALLYGGYWFVGSSTVEAQAKSALETLEEEGWDVAYSDLGTRGFPSRFDTTVTDISLQSPGGVGWSAPFMQFFALSYRPNEVIAAFPDEQTVSVAGESYGITSKKLRASASVSALPSMPFRAATIEAAPFDVSFPGETELKIEKFLLATRRAEGDAPVYDIFGEAGRLIYLDREMFLPAPIDRIAVSAKVTLDAELDRAALDRTAPEIVQIDIENAVLRWIDMQIKASGTLRADNGGFAEGELLLEIREWARLIETLQAAGLIDPEIAPTYMGMLNELSGGEVSLELPLTFRGGQMRMGLVPLGPAPRLR